MISKEILNMKITKQQLRQIVKEELTKAQEKKKDNYYGGELVSTEY